jgi:hypothetical protein
VKEQWKLPEDLNMHDLFIMKSKTILAEMKGVKGGKREAEMDAKSSLSDSVSLPVLIAIFSRVMNEKKQTLNAAAAHAIFACCYVNCGRWDDASFVKMTDLCLPFRIHAIGKIQCMRSTTNRDCTLRCMFDQ